MLHRVEIRAADREASARFYETVLATLGVERTQDDEQAVAWRDFAVVQADDEHPPTRGLHVGFVAPSRAHADEFWRAGTEAGHPSDGAPGPRPVYGPDYYGAFLLDPDGNSAEAADHDSLRRGGIVDHLWIRVADVAAARRFWVELAPRAGLRVGTDEPDRVQLRGISGSFSLVAGERPTEHLHLTLPLADAETALAGPLTDPDGTTVTLVAPDAHAR